MSRKPLVLMVDDNELLRLSYRIALERAGFEVLLADDGVGGLELARAQIPDVILLDLNMPRLNGWQTVRVLSLDPRTAGVPVVAFTAERFGISITRLRSAGFRAYVDKSRSVQTMIDLVRLVLEDENRGKEWIDLERSGPATGRMKDAG